MFKSYPGRMFTSLKDDLWSQENQESRRRFLRHAVLAAAGVTVVRNSTVSPIGWTESAMEVEPFIPALQEARQQRSHEEFMWQAIAAARQVPRAPFGAVIVNRESGEIVATGYNRSSESPTFHGEIDVINRCAAAHPSIDWSRLDLYTTAEPCPMCQSAIEWAGIPGVYYGTSIPFLQSVGWSQIDIRAEEVSRRTPFRKSRVVGGILEGECNALFEAAQQIRG